MKWTTYTFYEREKGKKNKETRTKKTNRKGKKEKIRKNLPQGMWQARKKNELDADGSSSVCPTPRRGGIRFGTAKKLRAEQAVGFREDGREASKPAKGGGVTE